MNEPTLHFTPNFPATQHMHEKGPADDLLRDCRARESVLRKGGEVIPIYYLYYMLADEAVDAHLLQLLKHAPGQLPANLVGTVAKVSELQRHIKNLRAITRYRNSVIAVRVWNPNSTEPLRWDEPLELEEEHLGPIAILDDYSHVVTAFPESEHCTLEVHPDSRLGNQHFCYTRNETSANVFVSPSVSFPLTRPERGVVAIAGGASVAAFTLLCAIAGGLLGHAISSHHTTEVTGLAATIGFVVATWTMMPQAQREMRRWLRAKKDYAKNGERIFMRGDLFVTLRSFYWWGGGGVQLSAEKANFSKEDMV